VWASHGRLYLWGMTPRVAGQWRLGAEGILTGTTQSGGGWTSAAHGVGELLWTAPRWGFGLGAGPSTGWIANDTTRFVALHTRARAWWRPGGGATSTAWEFSVEPTRFFGQWFTDLGAGVTIRHGPAALSLSTDARLSAVYSSTGAGSASLQLFVGPSVSLEMGGGSYLRDPYQGFPRGGFFTFGLRIGSTRPARAVGTTRRAPLVPQRRGDSLVVRFRFPGVRSVAIAGDWSQWQPVPLRSLGASLWEGTLALKRGLYHFNVLVDGTDWVVPNGVATVPDGLGEWSASCSSIELDLRTRSLDASPANPYSRTACGSHFSLREVRNGQDQLGSRYRRRAVGRSRAERVRLRVLRRRDEERHGRGHAGAGQAATSDRCPGPVVHLPGLHLWDRRGVGVRGDPPSLRRGPQDRRDRGVAVWFFIALLHNLGEAPMGLYPQRMYVTGTIVALVQYAVAGPIGAYLYTEV